MQDLQGTTMSMGTLRQCLQRFAKRLKLVEQKLKAVLSQVEVIHQGLTRPHCSRQTHVRVTKHLTHYQVHANRGHKALHEISILKNFHWVSVYDGW